MKTTTTLIQIECLCAVLAVVGYSFSTVLSQGEDSSEDKSDVPIIRQINKVNEDGTYTYGYEAADGSFKIETRDVLGNVKGMFGYIDESGELKRVSYSANNSTGFRPRTGGVGYTTVRPSLSASTQGTSGSSSRRPVLILKNTPPPYFSTKAPVIQHIPPKKTSSSQEIVDDSSSTTSTSTTPAFGDYIDGRRVNSQSPTYSTKENETTEDDRVEEPALPFRSPSNSSPNSNPLRKVLVSKRPIDDSGKDTVNKGGKGGNALRRQLNRGGYELRGGGGGGAADISHVYTGADPNGRYVTSSAGLPPHLNALMSDLRPVQHRTTTTYQVSPAELAGYPPSASDSEVPVSPQDTTDVPLATTTTDAPYRSLGRYVVPISRYHARPSIVDDAHYSPGPEDAPQYRAPIPPPPLQASLPPISPIAAGAQTAAATYPGGGYYEPLPYSIPPALRDELTAIIHNYLQVRLNPTASVPPGSPLSPFGRLPYHHNPYYGNGLYPPPNINYPFLNQNFLPYPNLPYANPGLPPPIYPPIYNPNLFYPVPASAGVPPPYSNPNIQNYSPRPSAPGRNPVAPVVRSQSVRSAAATDDVDLLQMLLASPTKIPVHQLKYPSTTPTEKSTTEYRQPVRNVQIVSEESTARRVTTESPE